MTGEEGERRERGRGIGGGSGRRTHAGTDAESAVWFDTGLRKTPARLTTKGGDLATRRDAHGNRWGMPTGTAGEV